MSTFEVTCFSSPADGIRSGAVILQTGGEKGPKYLFNAPEGFARLVLEHKVRPSQHIRAAFLSQLQPQAAGGLAGLIMRLRQDGHDELQMHGPPGLAANLHGLRHFVQWKHPRVFASEHSQWDAPQVYEDGHVHIAALQQGGLAWPCPAWLQAPASATATAPSSHHAAALNGSGNSESSSSSDSQTKSSDDDAVATGKSLERVDQNGPAGDSTHAGVHHKLHRTANGGVLKTGFHQGRLDGATSAQDNSSDSVNGGAPSNDSGSDSRVDTESDSDDEDASSTDDSQTSDGDTSLEDNPQRQPAAFEKLDSLFAGSSASGSVSTHLAALDLLKRGAGFKTGSAGKAGSGPKIRSGGKQRSGLKAGSGVNSASGMKVAPQLPAGSNVKASKSSQQQRQQQQQTNRTHGRPGSESIATVLKSQVKGKGISMAEGDTSAESGGKEPQRAEWVQMQDGGNPLYLQQKGGKLVQGHTQKSGLGIWGYLVHFKATGQLLLFVDCPDLKALSAIQKHPVFHYMQQQSKRIAGLMHLTVATASSSRPYAQWLKALSGQQVLLDGGKQHIFQSAMRATAKLHLLSPAVFPLPFGAKIPPVKFASAEANTQVASITAAEAASSADDLTAVSEAQQTQHAQHAQQSPYGSQTDLKFQAPAVSVTNGQVKLSVPDGATAGLTAQHAQHAQQAVSTPVNGKSKARTPAALGGKLRIGGPVTKLVGSSKGLAVVQGDELDAKPQSLGKTQQELLDSKPALVTFIKQLKASHPEFFQELKPSQMPSPNPRPNHTPAAASLSPNLTSPPLQNAHQSSGQTSSKLSEAVTSHQAVKRSNGDDVWMSHGMSSGNDGSHSMADHSFDGAWPSTHYMSQHYQMQGPFQTPSHLQGNVGGAFPNMPHMPAPPPGYALVPVASDGSLHYPGAIVSAQPGGIAWQSQQQHFAHTGIPDQLHQQQPQPLTPQHPQGWGPQQHRSWRGPFMPAHHAPSHASLQQQQLSASTVPNQHEWQQQSVINSQNHRKRKLPGDQTADADISSGRLNGSRPGNSGGGGSGGGGSGGMMPDSNADAASKLRRRLKTDQSSDPNQSQAPQPDSVQSASLHPGCVQSPSPSGEPCPRQPGIKVEAVEQSPACGSGNQSACKLDQDAPAASSSTGSKQDLYTGPHGPGCLRADDRTLVNFLGTGSAEPSKYRGASAIHIRLDSGWGVLMDAGEGAWGALVRMYGCKVAQQQVDSLALVWVSHKHADHVLGLPGILAARSVTKPPLLVVGPSEAAKWLSDIGTAQQLRYRFMHCSQLNRMSQQQQVEMLGYTGLASLKAVPVNHCRDAFGLVMLHGDGWKLVYSGDTRPCRALQEAGKACTLLIHEATFEPELIDHAKAKKHSTTEEALQVAAFMGAYRTILTHFSQRYSKVPVALQTNDKANCAMIAFDGMTVPLSLLPDLPRLAEGVSLAFAVDESEGAVADE